MSKSSNPDLSLMDALYGWFFAKKCPLGRRLTPAVLRVQARHRTELRRAERFIIDDDSVRLSCHLSVETDDRLADRSFLARLPFDTVWLEYSLSAKLGEFREMGFIKPENYEDAANRRSGFLLTRDETDGARWVAHEFFHRTTPDEDKVTNGVLSYVFDPECDGFEPVRGSKLWRSAALATRPGWKPFAVTNIGGEEVPLTRIDPEHATLALFKTDELSALMTARTAVIPDPFFEAYLLDAHKDDIMPFYRSAVRDQRNELRWLLTLLAMINGLPREIRPAKIRPGTRSDNFHILPYLQHHEISIKVPKENRVAWANQCLDRTSRNAKRPLHDVIGHWRIVEYGKAQRGRICRHQPTMVEHGLGMCERCQMLIRWIPPHQRGDPNIGIISHTYRVKT